ncbi:hypothetical protein AN963_04615 [Brevibacillus choshinensis]|uniref:Transposase n=1 Tax=Brevibacillus choshinensis TaxID=54911 RepID=A0ABR5NCG5_BRECH|nr:hypothetical protein AN963_04615 [Brevibacillus choshinensis]
MDELRMFKQFIHAAELVWTQIATSPRGKPVYTINNVDFTPLPERYNSKRKISRIFRRYWGRQLSETMIRNLNLRLVKGKLCVPYGEIPPFPTVVQSLQLKLNRPNQKVVSVVLSGANKKVRVDYRLIRVGATAPYTIMKRSGKEYDRRYRPPVASSAAKAKAKPAPKPAPKPASKPVAKPKPMSNGRKKLLKTP